MNPKEIKDRYKKAAIDYDERSTNDEYKAHKIIALWALKDIKTKNAKILDLGCGTGLSSIEFLSKNYEVIGIDISKEMLQKAKKYSFKKLICQDLEKPLKVNNYEFDVIMLVGTMEFIRNPLKLFKQIYDKLKNKGSFFITIPRKLSKSKTLPIISYKKVEIENLFKKARFKITESKSFFGYYKQTEKSKEVVNYYGYLLKKK